LSKQPNATQEGRQYIMTTPKAANGRFRKLIQTERIQRDAKAGMSVQEIASKRNVRYQTVWRTLNRTNRSRVIASKVELDPTAEPCNNADCMTGKSPICECKCQGRWHGASTPGSAVSIEVIAQYIQQ
jgi:hypothetical protein